MGVNAPRAVGASGRSPYAPHDQANGVVQGSFAAVGPSAPFAFYGWFNVSIWGSTIDALTTTAGSLSSSISSAGTVAAGDSINSVNVPAGSTVGAISGTTVTIAVPPITVYGLTTVGSAVVTGLDFTDGLLGAAVTGSGVPASTTVLSVDIVAIPPDSAQPGSKGVKGQVTLSHNITSANSDNRHTPLVFQRTGNAITVSGADAAAFFTGAGGAFSGTVQLERSFDGGSTYIPVSLTPAGTTAAKWTAEVSTEFMEPERGVLYRLNATIYSSGTINYRLSTTGQAATTVNVPM